MSLQFKYDKTCCISKQEIISESFRLEKIINVMNEAVKTNYQTDFAFLNLPYDNKFLKESINLSNQFKNVGLIVVVGIGGSNLGIMALHSIINKAEIAFADTVDSDNINEIINKINKCFKEKKDVVLNCITKSGKTLETIANFEVILEVMKKARKDYKKFIVITTNKNSKLWEIGKKENFNLLEIPEKLSGRYSVLSNVGLFPLTLAKLDSKKILEGAKSMRIHCLNRNVLRNPAALSALITFLHYRRGKNISNLFVFSNSLENLGKWCRQLLAESIGKEKDSLGRLINAGITPIISIGTTDLHSMLQLYLAGPNDKITTFAVIKKTNKIKVPKLKEFTNFIKNINGKELNVIMNSIYESVKKTYLRKNLPFMEIILNDKSEYCLGQLMQFKMMEVVYLAYLLNVNPFDQPDVEEYKIGVKL